MQVIFSLCRAHHFFQHLARWHTVKYFTSWLKQAQTGFKASSPLTQMVINTLKCNAGVQSPSHKSANSIQQNPSLEADSCSARQEMPRLQEARLITVSTRVHRWGPILNWLNPTHILKLCFFKIHFSIIFTSMPRSRKWSLPLKLSG